MVGVARRWFATGLAEAVMALNAKIAEVIEYFIVALDMTCHRTGMVVYCAVIV